MNILNIGTKVITTVECFDIPVGTEGVIEVIHWAEQTEGVDVYCCYGIRFNNDKYHETEEWYASVWNYYNTEIIEKGE